MAAHFTVSESSRVLRMLPQGFRICYSFCLEGSLPSPPPADTSGLFPSLRYYSSVSIFLPPTTLSPFPAFFASQHASPSDKP